MFIISLSFGKIQNDALLSPDPHSLETLGMQDNKKI
jgi:hypothetical protein